MNKRNIEAIYPLSPMQQGMLFHSIYSPDSGVYFEQLTCELEGELNIPAFQKAWEQVVQRHSALRTSFVWKRLDKTLQVVHKQVELPFEVLDWRELSSSEQEARLEETLQENTKQGFNLSAAPLMRLTLIALRDNCHQFIWCHHHLLLDGWSMPLVIKEVFSCYEAFRQNLTLQLNPGRPFRDYIAWIQKQDLKLAESFWRKTLQGFTAPTPLIEDSVVDGSTDNGKDYDDLKILLDSATSAELQALARRNQITLNTIVQGAWALLLSHYSREDDIVFGATVSGRPAELSGVESMLGLFINTLPIRVLVDSQASVVAWLRKIQAQQIDLRQFEYTSLTQIQGWSDVPRDVSLFDTILVFENYPVDTTLKEQKTSLQAKNIRSMEQTNFPLTLVASPGKEIFLQIAYDARRFRAETIQRMIGHLQEILCDFAAQPEQSLSHLNILTEPERTQLLVEWNQTQAEYPAEKCIHELFEAQVEKNPDAVALVLDGQYMTYADLNRRANQLAHYLLKKNVQPETLIGICMERSFSTIVSMLGALKAGAAYLPLDPNYPNDRLAYIFEDSHISVLLTQSKLVDSLPPVSAEVCVLDENFDLISNESDSSLPTRITPDNLAYVIYTSGSTGRPKGTLLNHQGLNNFTQAYRRSMGIGSQDRVLQFASISFDASVAEIYLALLSGARLVLAPQEVLLSVVDLAHLIQEEGVTTATLPPSMLAVLPAENLPSLKIVMSAGESCTKAIVDRWSQGKCFMNGYGPTEATIGASWQQLENLPENIKNLPIGKPIENKLIYILDPHSRPVPVGIPGELCIGGVGLARGYLNRPDLTADKFVPNPFSQAAGDRLYRTGDLVRYLPEGVIEFLGRIDFQVKVRGFRIELGEIESVLNQHPGIQSASVLAPEDKTGSRRLVAYFTRTPDVDVEPTTSELHNYMKDKLPDYMVPSIFMLLEEFPLTPAGKIDRRALPEPEQGRPELGRIFVAARTPTEELLSGIWAQVLDVEKVGVFDDFFELGGHSLLGVKLQSRIRDTFQIELPLRHLFESSTIAALAPVVEQMKLAEKGIEAPPIEPVPRDAALPLSFAQQRLWFLDQLEPNSPFYNIPTGLRVTGRLNISALEQSIGELIRRHEILRTVFKTVKGKPFQEILPDLPLSLTVTDLQAEPENERAEKVQELATAEARQAFNLSDGPLFRVSLLKLSAEEHVILFTMHHIISDGWSMGVMIREVVMVYEGIAAGKTLSLGALPIQYADFAHWQRNWLQGEVMEQQIDYWRNQLTGSPPILELPTDRPRPAMQSFKGSTLARHFSRNLLDSLIQLSQQKGTTLFMTLLAGFNALLSRYTDQTDICVGTPHANRNRSEMENLIGFFVNTLVMRTDLDGDPTFQELLQRVREVAFGAYAHQDMPFETLVEALQPNRDLSHTPLFQVMFVFQNTPPQTLEMSGLTFSPLETESGSAKFDLSLVLAEEKDGLLVSFEYNTDLFDESTILRLVDHFEVLLQSVVADPEQKISALPLLTEPETRQLFTDWNRTEAKFPADKCMHQWFEELVSQNPDAIAVTFEDTELSYAELNQRANQLARHLRQFDLPHEGLVGICMDRSIEMVVSILGTLKAGGAFIPLDPVYPQERLDYMISDSSISILLTQQALAERFSTHNTRVVCVDLNWEQIAAESNENLNLEMNPFNLAYVIYTSGSTGKPKGTMLQHQGWCNLAKIQQQAFGVRPGSRILQFSSFSFDASVWEFVMALLSGATLCLTQRETLTTGQGLLEVMAKNRITTVTLPPSVLAVVPETPLPDLKTIVTAGEACSPDLVARWSDNRRFFNAYGPTESTVCASMFHVVENIYQNPPIGRPNSNFKLYVLDSNLRPVPVGVPGELIIGGIGLARGYLNRPELTAEKFVADPYSGQPDSRMYRTGDLARLLTDGNIEFLGRIDHQVKVRGFRIELGEIEVELNEHPDIVDVVVLAREFKSGDHRLVAYLVAESGAELTVGDLRVYLKKKLPDYMVPSAFMIMDEFPLTPNGKIDRKALPMPDQSRPELGSTYTAPRNETEEKLAEICVELLEVEKVGVYDNFFELGGHSLLATQFISRVREDFQVELPLRILFESPTVNELAEQVLQRPKISDDDEQAAKFEMTERGEKNMAELLAELGSLSDEEAQALLSQEMKD